MVTLDSNVVVYAFSEAGAKTQVANRVLREVDFVSTQVLNEFSVVAFRKHRRSWAEIERTLDDIRSAAGRILPIEDIAATVAVRIADRHKVAFYDALMLAVALRGGATKIYSEDMHNGLVIDGTLRVVNPFASGALT